MNMARRPVIVKNTRLRHLLHTGTRPPGRPEDAEPQENRVFAPYRDTIRRVADAMRRAQDETGEAKIFSANITADDPFEMIARGE